MTDTDPEDEVGDVPRPVDLVVETPDTDTRDDQVKDHPCAQRRDHGADRERCEPDLGDRRLGVATHDVGDFAEGALARTNGARTLGSSISVPSSVVPGTTGMLRGRGWTRHFAGACLVIFSSGCMSLIADRAPLLYA